MVRIVFASYLAVATVFALLLALRCIRLGDRVSRAILNGACCGSAWPFFLGVVALDRAGLLGDDEEDDIWRSEPVRRQSRQQRAA